MFVEDVHYSLDMEKAILGISILVENSFGRVYGFLEEKNFYSDNHRVVFSCMREMFESNMPIDHLTLKDFMVRKKSILSVEEYKTSWFLSTLTNRVTEDFHLEYWCSIVKSMWIERQLYEITSSGIANLAGDDNREVISSLYAKLEELNKDSNKSDFKDMSELMIGLYAHQDKMRETGGKGITTGFKKIDSLQGGFHPGNLVVIGARPSVGKSALADQMAHAISTAGIPVGFITLEMNNNEVAARIAAIDTQTDFRVIYRGLYRDSHQAEEVYERIAANTAHLPIYVSDQTGVNVIEIKAKAQKLKSQHGVQVLIVDYLQLVESQNSYNKNRENEVSAISRGFKLIAKELGITVIVLAQLNRTVTQRKGDSRYPELSDFRESGAIEQDADVVIFLHKDYLSGITQDEDGNTTEFEADLIVRKWRNEAANTFVKLDWIGGQMRFEERKENNGFNSQKNNSNNSNPF